MRQFFDRREEKPLCEDAVSAVRGTRLGRDVICRRRCPQLFIGLGQTVTPRAGHLPRSGLERELDDIAIVYIAIVYIAEAQRHAPA